MRTLALSTLLLPALAASAAAQAPLTPIPPSTAWPSTHGPVGTAVTRTCAGDFNGNFHPDAMALRGANPASSVEGEVVYVEDPGFSDGLRVTGWMAYDCDLGLPEVSQDSLAYVNDVGLHQASWNGTSTLLDSTQWSGAVRVRRAQIDTGTEDDFVGIAANGRTVLVRNAAGTTSTFDPVALGSVSDLAVGHYDSDVNQMELCLVVGSSVEVWKLGASPSLVRSESFFNAGGCVCAFRDGSEDRFACVLPKVDPSEQFLAVLGANGQDEASVDFGVMSATQISSGDFDGDGYDEVGIVQPIGSSSIVLMNQRSSSQPLVTAFVHTDLVVLGSGVSSALNAAEVAFVDVDNDGIDEALCAKPHAGVLEAYSLDSIDSTSAFAPQFEEGSTPILDDSTGTITIQIVAPSQIPAGTEMEIALYVQSEFGEPYSFVRKTYEPAVGYDEIEEVLPGMVGELDFPEVFTFVLRLVKRSGGSVTQAYPTGVIGLCGLDADVPDMQAEATNAGLSTTYEYTEGPSGSINEYGGGAGRRPKLIPSNVLTSN